MKKIKSILILIICLNTINVYPQYSYTSHMNNYFEDFFNTVTLVPIIGNKIIDEKIKETLEKNWKYTKIRYVPLIELERADYSIVKNKNISVINLFSLNIENVFGNRSLCLYMPGNINSTRMTNIIASVPIKCGFSGEKKFMVECEFDEIGYKIDILLMQIIEVVEFVKNEEYSPTLAHVTGINKYIKKYNNRIIRNNNKIKIKPLLINESFFNQKLDSIKFKRYYENDVKIVSDKEYKKILNSDNSEYFVMLQSNIPNSIISIVDLEINKTIYIGLNFAKTPFPSGSKLYRLNKKQVKNLNQHIKKITVANN